VIPLFFESVGYRVEMLCFLRSGVCTHDVLWFSFFMVSKSEYTGQKPYFSFRFAVSDFSVRSPAHKIGSPKINKSIPYCLFT